MQSLSEQSHALIICHLKRFISHLRVADPVWLKDIGEGG
jgi:hypothetical protein